MICQKHGSLAPCCILTSADGVYSMEDVALVDVEPQGSSFVNYHWGRKLHGSTSITVAKLQINDSVVQAQELSLDSGFGKFDQNG